MMNEMPHGSERHVRKKLTLAPFILGLGLLMWLSTLGGSWAMPQSAPLLELPTGCISGHFMVGGAQTVGSTIPVPCLPYTIYLELIEQELEAASQNVLLSETIPIAADEYGQFEYCGIPPGTYTVIMRGFNTLANMRIHIYVPPGGVAAVDFGVLTPGDASGNNAVDILDYSILAMIYGDCSGPPDWDRRADFDCSGCVDILDYSLLATHYGETGDTAP